MDDRRGPRRDREFDRERAERRRSVSPPPKKREPTPDLTDVIPVLERRRRLTQWDIKPPGYDNVTAEQAKLSGMFPLPGAPRQQAMDPTKLQAFMNQPGGSSANSTALKPTNSRQSRRLIISNLPPSATEESLVNFFNLQLNGLNMIEGADPCVQCHVAPDHAFAMLEFRNSPDATVALALDGISMEAADDAHMANGNGNGAAPAGLHIRRPKDYIVPAVVEDPNYDPDSDVPSSVVIDSPNKISVTNLPLYLTDDQVMELLVSFGKLKSFALVKDNGTQESRVRFNSSPNKIHRILAPLTLCSGYRVPGICRPLRDQRRHPRAQQHDARRARAQGAEGQHRHHPGGRGDGRQRHVYARGHHVHRLGPEQGAAAAEYGDARRVDGQ